MLFFKVLLLHMTETGDKNLHMCSVQCLFSHVLFAFLQLEDVNI